MTYQTARIARAVLCTNSLYVDGQLFAITTRLPSGIYYQYSVCEAEIPYLRNPISTLQSDPSQPRAYLSYYDWMELYTKTHYYAVCHH